MHYFAIGDISGYFDSFLALSKKSRLNLLALGDIVDRGPDSKRTIQFFIDNPNHVAIMGNHEHMFIKTYEQVVSNQKNIYHALWWIFVNGGNKTLESYGIKIPSLKQTRDEIKQMDRFSLNALEKSKEVESIYAQFNKIPIEHINYLKQMPLFIETDTHFFSHAPINNWNFPDLFKYDSFDSNHVLLDLGCLWNRKNPDKERKDSKIVVYGHQNVSSVLAHTKQYPKGIYLKENDPIPENTWGLCIDTSKNKTLVGYSSQDHKLFYEKI